MKILSRSNPFEVCWLKLARTWEVKIEKKKKSLRTHSPLHYFLQWKLDMRDILVQEEVIQEVIIINQDSPFLDLTSRKQ